MRQVFALTACVAILVIAASATGVTTPVLPQLPDRAAEEVRPEVDAVLIDPASGAAIRLSQPGRRISFHDFSPDGRWLVYTSFPEEPGIQQAELFRIDLHASRPSPERLTTGYWPSYSSTGSLAFVRQRSDDVVRSLVMTPDGAVHELRSPGQPTSWSPDGRWLTINEGYRGKPARATTFR